MILGTLHCSRVNYFFMPMVGKGSRSKATGPKTKTSPVARCLATDASCIGLEFQPLIQG